jgi:epoxyqueuosine reductase
LSELRERLAVQAAQLGADAFGVADLTPARVFIVDQGGEFLGRFPRAVSVGVRLPEGIVDELPRHAAPAVALTYNFLVYSTVNSALDNIALAISRILQEAGFAVLPVPTSQTVNAARYQGLFSQKLAAHLAGLGWIGKSCLLITPEHGPRVRWVSVLTDAPLAPGQPMAERCRSCKLCVEACPASAFTGAKFEESEPREARMNAQACYDYREGMFKISGARTCGMCVYVCPYGRKKPG